MRSGGLSPLKWGAGGKKYSKSFLSPPSTSPVSMFRKIMRSSPKVWSPDRNPPPGAAGKRLMSNLNVDRDVAVSAGACVSVCYLNEGAQWLHIWLLCVQEGHHHMFPHVLRRWRKRRHLCFSSIFITHICGTVCVCIHTLDFSFGNPAKTTPVAGINNLTVGDNIFQCCRRYNKQSIKRDNKTAEWSMSHRRSRRKSNFIWQSFSLLIRTKVKKTKTKTFKNHSAVASWLPGILNVLFLPLHTHPHRHTKGPN